MPRKERRQKEKARAYEKDGDYGMVDTAYVFGNPTFRRMPAAWKCLEILAWLACFKERTDHLKPEWVEEIKRLANTQRSLSWRKASEYLAKSGRWTLNDDGSIIVMRIKEKRPNFPWKGKGQNRQNEGTKTGNIESITLSIEKGRAEGAPFPIVKPEDDWATKLFEEHKQRKLAAEQGKAK